MNSLSENEDDPQCSSGEDWKEEEEKKRNKRRLSSRLSKKPRIALIESFTSDEDSEEEKKAKARSRNGVVKRRGRTRKDYTQIPSINEVLQKANAIPQMQKIQIQPVQNIFSDKSEFASGSFVITKTDAQSFDEKNPPHIWRIDGKALLQKFEPIVESGNVQFRNTSVYTGWSPMDTDKYATLKNVRFISNLNSKIIVSFDSDQLKEIFNDSE